MSAAARAVEPVKLAELAIRLELERPLRFIDLETTGTSVERDRVVEIAVLSLEPTGRATRWCTRVNPGMPIPAAATKVHGITDDDVRDAPPFETFAGGLARRLLAGDVAGFNVRSFDLPLLTAEFERAGVDFDVETVRVVDACQVFHLREPRDLSAAMRFYVGREHEGAHGALADVEASAAVLLAQLERYEDLPHEIGALAEYCAAVPEDAVTRDGRVVFRDGAAQLSFGKWAGTPLRRVDARYLRWMLNQSFPKSTKRVIEAALRGEFPIGPLARSST